MAKKKKGGLPKGTVIKGRRGSYTIDETFAAGGFSRIYSATDHDGREVVVKTLRKTARTEDSAVDARFDREASILELLKSPYTVRYDDHGEADGNRFLVMERLYGPTLTAIIEEGPQAPERVERILVQILRSLEEAHENGIVHRDLKPGNILVCASEDGNEECKLIDFGLAKILEDKGIPRKSLTADGMLVGTPGYLAPELLEGTEVTAAADLYVVGLIGHELLMGEQAYQGLPMVKAQKQFEGNPPPPPTILRETTLYRVIEGLLERSPSKRYRTATEALADLGRVSRGQQPVGVEKRGNPMFLWIGIALVVIGGVVAALML